jgi:hypothetical protein
MGIIIRMDSGGPASGRWIYGGPGDDGGSMEDLFVLAMEATGCTKNAREGD